MRLVTIEQEGVEALGALRGDMVVLLGRARDAWAGSAGRQEARRAPGAATFPSDMMSFLRGGEEAASAVRLVLEYVDELYLRRETAGEAVHGLAVPLSGVRLKAPIPRPGKILCIGLNYRDHAAELGMKLPERPLLFAKYANAVIGPGEPILLPGITRQVDYEAELVAVIGMRAKGVSAAEAMDYVAGYTLMNDVSARDVQFGDGQWVRGKTFDSFAPLGPALVTRDEVPDPHNLAISLRLNGETMQSSSTSQLLFGVPELVSFLSEAITLEPGDVIATGTPPGVGQQRNPQVFLKPGDVVQVEVEGIGVLENPVAG